MEEKKEKKKTSSNTLREFSAGGVVFKKEKNKYFWLITHSVPSKAYPHDVWRLPKGWVDDDGLLPGPIASGSVKAQESDLQNAALREVLEEGGVSAKIIKKIGTETFVFNSKLRNGKVLKFVTFYLMSLISEDNKVMGDETSEIMWLEYSSARKKLTQSGERKILDKAKKVLDLGIQGSLV